jgi:hypothetical protein
MGIDLELLTILYHWQLGGAVIIYKIFNTYSWAFALTGMYCLLASLFVIVIKNKI